MGYSLLIVEEDLASFLPESLLGAHQNEAWQDNTIVGIWFVLLIGYILSMAPLVVLSFFFWILAVEWSLESTLHFSMESFDIGDDDESGEEDHHSEYCTLIDRLQESQKYNNNNTRFLHALQYTVGLLRFSTESNKLQAVTVEEEEETREKGLDKTHYHHLDVPLLTKADWN
jgi:hypothetical protein